MEFQKREKARSSQKVIEATIAITGTVSTVADLNGFTIAGLIIPTLDAANLTFQVSATGVAGSFVNLEDTTPAVLTIAAAGGNFAVSDAVLINALMPWRYIQITASAPQVTAERVFSFVVKA